MGIEVADDGKLSLVYGAPLASEAGLGALTIPGYLSEVVKRYGEREALVLRRGSSAERWTYRQLWQHAYSVAKALIALGAARDTRVGILMTNRPEFLSSFFGAAMAGAVPVPISTFSTANELEQLLSLSEVSVLLVESRILKQNFVELLTRIEPEIAGSRCGQLYSAKFPYLRALVQLPELDVGEVSPAAGFIDWPFFLAAGENIADGIVDARIARVSPADRGGIFFSSGTTSLPKAIVHTQRAFAIQWWRYPRLMNVEKAVRSWTGNGYFWSANITQNVGLALSTGGTIVLQPYFDAKSTLSLIQDEQVSFIAGRPHQWARMQEAENWDCTDLSSLEYITRAQQFEGHPTVYTDWVVPMGYGNTETMSISTSNVYDPACNAKKDAFGVPCPGNALKIIDPLSGAVVPVGERGEVCLKGATLMQGYLGKVPEDTFDSEGFLHTGDGGYVDKDGCLFFEGRLTEVIKTGGANVSPLEIDAVIALYPDVQRTQTLGMPDEILGERIVTCIVPRDGITLDTEKLSVFLKERLASFKHPKEIFIVKQEDINVTGSGKVKVDQLRETVAKLCQ